MIELADIVVEFAGRAALRGVSLSVGAGEVVGLMGDNGSGKSTLLKVIAGALQPTSGRVLLDGRDAGFASAAEARAGGIEMVYQDLALCDNLSATANIFLGRELFRRVGPFRVLDRRGMNRTAATLLGELRSGARPGGPVGRMSGGERQAVAIARAMQARARILLLDEPTAAISVPQVAEVRHLINRLRQRGVAVVLVSHRVDDVFSVADRVVVLRSGRKIVDRPVGETSADAIEEMVGAVVPGV